MLYLWTADCCLLVAQLTGKQKKQKKLSTSNEERFPVPSRGKPRGETELLFVKEHLVSAAAPCRPHGTLTLII